MPRVPDTIFIEAQRRAEEARQAKAAQKARKKLHALTASGDEGPGEDEDDGEGGSQQSGSGEEESGEDGEEGSGDEDEDEEDEDGRSSERAASVDEDESPKRPPRNPVSEIDFRAMGKYMVERWDEWEDLTNAQKWEYFAENNKVRVLFAR